MSNSIQTKLMLLVLCLALLNACKDKGAEEAGTVPPVVVETTTMMAMAGEQDLTKLPQEAVKGLRLTAEVLDEENWIIGLTWENVGDIHLSLPMYGQLKSDIDLGYAAPFSTGAYNHNGNTLNHPKLAILDKGKHADSKIFDISRDEKMLENEFHEILWEDWGIPGDKARGRFRFYQYLSLGIGEKSTCFFRFPRYKSDEESGRWKKGDRIPVDFRYFVGEEVPAKNGVTLTSGENGQPRKHLPPSAWRGEVYSNVVYLHWNSGGERIMWPSSLEWPEPAQPVNNLLLSLEIIDKEAWIVRLKWKNVGDTPLEVPVTTGLMRDIKAYDGSRKYDRVRVLSGVPFLFRERYYSNFRYYGRPFGTSLDRGRQGDANFFDVYRDGNYSWNNDKYHEKNGFYVHGRSCYTLNQTEWIHLRAGEVKEIDFKFPRFESDDRNERWQEQQKIPIEFFFKAGEIPNSEPPYRETGKDGQSDLRRFPAWQGEVFSNVVFFRWTSEGERMKAPEPSK